MCYQARKIADNFRIVKYIYGAVRSGLEQKSEKRQSRKPWQVKDLPSTVYHTTHGSCEDESDNITNIGCHVQSVE